jgi:hypothetical protein
MGAGSGRRSGWATSASTGPSGTPSGYWWDGVTYTSRVRRGRASTTSPSRSTGTPATRTPSEMNSRRGGEYPGSSTATRSPGEQNPRQDVKGLLRAAGDSHIIRRSLDSTGDSDVSCDGFPQTAMPGRVAVHACGEGLGAQLAGHQAPPRLVREERRIRKPSPELEPRWLVENRGYANGIPNGPGS